MRSQRKLLVLLFPLLVCCACSATTGWFTTPSTQHDIAEGCKAAAMDDNTHNALLNATMSAVPQLAPVVAALNIAHLAIQAAYAKCVSNAQAGAVPAAPST